jgi:hypothetical protein
VGDCNGAYADTPRVALSVVTRAGDRYPPAHCSRIAQRQRNPGAEMDRNDGGNLNERESPAFPVRHISRLPARDRLVARLHDCLDANPRSTNTARTSQLSGVAVAEGASEPPKPDDGQLFHIPGSTKSYTDTQINRSTSTVDWFPELHPAPPAPVISGKNGRVPRVWAVSPFRRPRQA